MCEFVELNEELPNEVDFCRSLADLHARSMDHSLDGQFGCHVTTCNGTVPQHTALTASWEEFFIETLKSAFELEE